MSAGREEDLFRALVEGEIDESSTEVREMFKKQPEREREWRETKAILSELARSGRTRREVLAAVARQADAPGADRAERVLREAMSESLSEPAQGGSSPVVRSAESADPRIAVPTTALRHPARKWPWFAAAAAALLCAFTVLRWRSSVREDRDQLMLGAPALEMHATFDTASGSLRFEWTGQIPPGAQFAIAIEGKNNESDTWRDVKREEKISGHQWSAAKTLTDGWPRKLRWRVLMSAGGEDAWSDWSFVSLPR